MPFDNDPVVIDNIQYNIEEEDLDEVNYLEIITMDEIIKDNPTFIAFSKEEIYDELFNFFENTNKAESLIELFYKNNKINLQNYVFIADASKKEYSCDRNDAVDTLENIKKYIKNQYNIYKEEINKYYFALFYNVNSKYIRLKPYMKTVIQLESNVNNKKINLYYPIYVDDDTNIPIVAAYYKIPVCVQNDYISKHILSHTKMPQKINYISSESFSDITKLIKIIQPMMKKTLEYMTIDENDFDIDYSNVDNFLHKFNKSFDDINVSEFELLKEQFTNFLEIKSFDIKVKGFALKKIKVNNSKLSFYEILTNLTKLVDISEKSKQNNDITIQLLKEQIVQYQPIPIVYTNIHDIINAYNNGQIEFQEVVNNIEKKIKEIIIDNAIKNLENIQNHTEETIDNFINLLNDQIARFHDMKLYSKDLFELHFMDFYKEINEIKVSEDYSDYQGIPEDIKNIPNYIDFQEVDNIFDDFQYNPDDIKKQSVEKYLKSTKYSHDIGFIELLEIVLNILQSIQTNAKIPIDFDFICNELYNYFSGIPSKRYIMQSIFDKNDISKTSNEIDDIIKINPSIVLNKKDYDEDIPKYVIECNEYFVKNLFDMLSMAIANWSLKLQEELIDDEFFIEVNKFSPNYFDNWSAYGILESLNSNKSVLQYIVKIAEDILSEINIYTVPKDMKGKVINTINDKMKDYYQDLKNKNLMNIKNKKNKREEYYAILKNMITDTSKKLNKNSLLNNYINALIYMPVSKTHKYLLGCCLQKIGKDFKAYSDFLNDHEGNTNIFKYRKYIYRSKNLFEKIRQTSKKSINIYHPIPDTYDTDTQDVDKIHKKFIKPDVKLDVEKSDMNDFLQNIKSPLLPKDIIDRLKKNPQSLSELTESILTIFCNTAMIKKRETITNITNLLLNSDQINYINILKFICVHFNKHIISGNLDDNQIELLKTSIKNINHIIVELKKLEQFIDEYNISNIKKIKKYVMVVSLCLPFDPNKVDNNVLLPITNTSNIFVKNIIQLLYSNLIEYLKITKIPTMEENIEYKNSIREKNKNELLNLMNTKTNDERDLMMELKKIGLKKEINIENMNDKNEYQDNQDNQDNDENMYMNNEEDYKDYEDYDEY